MIAQNQEKSKINHILTLTILWLLGTVSDRLWFAFDKSVPAWDQADYLTGSLTYLRALQNVQLFSGEWWRHFWELSPAFVESGGPNKISNLDTILGPLTEDYNDALDLAIADLEESLSEATITLVDFDSIFDNIIDNPTEFGFTNVTDSWLDTVLKPSACNDAFADCSDDLPNPDEYLYWDQIHPTKAFHKLLANEALSALEFTG